MHPANLRPCSQAAHNSRTRLTRRYAELQKRLRKATIVSIPPRSQPRGTGTKTLMRITTVAVSRAESKSPPPQARTREASERQATLEPLLDWSELLMGRAEAG